MGRYTTKIRRRGLIGFALLCVFSVFLADIALAGTATVEEQEPKYEYVSRPSERFLMYKRPLSKDRLKSNSIVGVTQGIDSNPLLDSTKKADGYTREILGMNFNYPICDSGLGAARSVFGFDMTSINYYRITDVNIFDGRVYAGLEKDLFGAFTAGVGYGFETLWFPNDRNGTFLANEVNASLKQRITKRTYQKIAYRAIFKDFTDRKAKLGTGLNSSNLRWDSRNALEHELGWYATDITKLKIRNEIYLNESNDQYYDYYDYLNYRLGASIVQFLNPKLYTITAFYYQRRNYDSRLVSDKAVTEKDDQYIVTTSCLYDITKNVSILVNYSHTENQTNEPQQKYSDNLYTTGLYYIF